MKEIVKYLFLLVCCVVLITGCKKDDPPKTATQTVENYMKINGNKYVFSMGYLIHDGNAAGWTIEKDCSILQLSLMGMGGCFFDCDVITTNKSYIDNGSYNNIYDEAIPYGSPLPKHSFTHGAISLMGPSANYHQSLYSGSMTVNREGTTYEIKINGIAENGDTIAVYYKSGLMYTDASESW